ncbi:hypothetical protein Lesp01_90200 [Lentzea sp. NBRC 102530]|nr:hypothetical protein Lesp01_90200 [Lentzea sp. NBRC 102530]
MEDPIYNSCAFEWPIEEGKACEKPGYTTHFCYIESTEHHPHYGVARSTHRCLCGEVHT